MIIVVSKTTGCTRTLRPIKKMPESGAEYYDDENDEFIAIKEGYVRLQDPNFSIDPEIWIRTNEC